MPEWRSSTHEWTAQHDRFYFTTGRIIGVAHTCSIYVLSSSGVRLVRTWKRTAEQTRKQKELMIQLDYILNYILYYVHGIKLENPIQLHCMYPLITWYQISIRFRPEYNMLADVKIIFPWLIYIHACLHYLKPLSWSLICYIYLLVFILPSSLLAGLRQPKKGGDTQLG